MITENELIIQEQKLDLPDIGSLVVDISDLVMNRFLNLYVNSTNGETRVIDLGLVHNSEVDNYRNHALFAKYQDVVDSFEVDPIYFVSNMDSRLSEYSKVEPEMARALAFKVAKPLALLIGDFRYQGINPLMVGSYQFSDVLKAWKVYGAACRTYENNKL